jgi:hypothetical protein
LPGSLSHTTQSQPAYEPPYEGIRVQWRLLIAALLLTAIAAVSLRQVCHPDVAGANESGMGVRHERHGTIWYHCEPWIHRALRG